MIVHRFLSDGAKDALVDLAPCLLQFLDLLCTSLWVKIYYGNLCSITEEPVDNHAPNATSTTCHDDSLPSKATTCVRRIKAWLLCYAEARHGDLYRRGS